MTSVWTVLLVGLLTGSATLLGGALALHYKRTFDPLLGFSSGAVIGVALFDLLPEGLNLAGELLAAALELVGFLLALVGQARGIVLGHRAGIPPCGSAHTRGDRLGCGRAGDLALEAALGLARRFPGAARVGAELALEARPPVATHLGDHSPAPHQRHHQAHGDRQGEEDDERQEQHGLELPASAHFEEQWRLENSRSVRA